MKLSKEAKETITDFFRFDNGLYLMTFRLALITLISFASVFFLIENEAFKDFFIKLPIPFMFVFISSMAFVPIISLVGTLAYGVLSIINLIGSSFIIWCEIINAIFGKVTNK